MPGKHHEPTTETRAQVSALKSYGHTLKEIATFLGICDDTLSFHYSRELATAETVANAEVARCLYKKATKKDDVTAQIFWLKTRARWRTEDSEKIMNQNDALRKEVVELREKLDAQNKKEF